MGSHLTDDHVKGGIAEEGDEADKKKNGWHSHAFGRSLSICFDLSDLAGSKCICLCCKRNAHLGAVLAGKLHTSSEAFEINNTNTPTKFAECLP
jgi:hypothetical protein